jgi:hypothetical protein
MPPDSDSCSPLQMANRVDLAAPLGADAVTVADSQSNRRAFDRIRAKADRSPKPGAMTTYGYSVMEDLIQELASVFGGKCHLSLVHPKATRNAG